MDAVECIKPFTSKSPTSLTLHELAWQIESDFENHIDPESLQNSCPENFFQWISWVLVSGLVDLVVVVKCNNRRRAQQTDLRKACNKPLQ